MAVLISDIDGITIEDPATVGPLMKGVDLAASLHQLIDPSQAHRLAADFALRSVNTLLAAASAKCSLAPPPPVDIELVTDSSGALIYRCRHKDPHRWRLDGTQV